MKLSTHSKKRYESGNFVARSSAIGAAGRVAQIAAAVLIGLCLTAAGTLRAQVETTPAETGVSSAQSESVRTASAPKSRFGQLADRIRRPFSNTFNRNRSRREFVRDRDGNWQALGNSSETATELQQDFSLAEEAFRNEDYSKAGSAFKSLARRYKDTPVEEEALFMQAESEFMRNRLPAAENTYTKLLKKYPTTRFLSQTMQRLYDIAYYWLEDSVLRSQGKPTNNSALSQRINLFDSTRPTFDSAGRAVNTIDTIQQYDPFGPLTDDAIMMAGAHEFVGGDYITAAGYYEQLVADQPKSGHSARAMILGAQAYLRSYPGPQYDGNDLENAHRMTKAALARGESLSREQHDRLTEDLRVIELEKAKRTFATADQYRGLRKYTSARFYYNLVINEHGDTPWADRAAAEIQRLDALPQQEPNMVARVLDRFRPADEATMTDAGAAQLGPPVEPMSVTPVPPPPQASRKRPWLLRWLPGQPAQSQN